MNTSQQRGPHATGQGWLPDECLHVIFPTSSYICQVSLTYAIPCWDSTIPDDTPNVWAWQQEPTSQSLCLLIRGNISSSRGSYPGVPINYLAYGGYGNGMGNHLRPDLKKGAFTADEERRIIELHAKMGNKWARMAAELPGRTDNEIKNFWNTRIKRRQRAGLPIYPPDILQAQNENHISQNMGTLSSVDTPHPELLPTNNLEIPSVEFQNLELNQQFYPSFLDIPASNLLTQGLGSTCSNSFLFSTMHPAKRLRESEPSLPGFSDVVSDVLPAFSQYQDAGSQKIDKSFGSSYDDNLSSSLCLLPGSHALLNGNSSSESISWAMKLELPSLQYSDTQVGSWGTPSPLPSLESVDTLIQTPPTELTQSDCLSPRNNGLLESVLYESRTLKNSKNNSCQQTSNASATRGDGANSSSQLHDADWDVYADPNSPLGHSVASVFSEYTPLSGNSLDEPQSIKTPPVKQEAAEWASIMQCEGEDGNSCQMNVSRPDFLLDSNWFGPSTERGKDHSILTDAIGALLGEDFNSDCKQIVDVAASSQGCSNGSQPRVP